MTLDRVDQKSAITFLNVFLTIIIIKTNKLGTQKAEWIKSLLYKMFFNVFSQKLHLRPTNRVDQKLKPKIDKI